MRIRMRFAKLGRVRWTSHRDVARMWERALRRAGLPLAYSAGFSPRPLLSFGLALPTGCESVAEYLDLTAAGPVDVDGLAAMLSPLLPGGVDVLAAAELEPGAPSLQQDVTACSWEIEVSSVSPGVLAERLDLARSADHLPVQRERKGRTEVDDLRPSVVSLTGVPSAEGGVRLHADLRTQPRGVRPSELAAALGIELGPARRTHQWIERDGSRREPLPLPASSNAEPWERAS